MPSCVPRAFLIANPTAPADGASLGRSSISDRLTTRLAAAAAAFSRQRKVDADQVRGGEAAAEHYRRIATATADVDDQVDRIELDVGQAVEHPAFCLAQQEIGSRVARDPGVVGHPQRLAIDATGDPARLHRPTV